MKFTGYFITFLPNGGSLDDRCDLGGFPRTAAKAKAIAEEDYTKRPKGKGSKSKKPSAS